MRYFIYDHLDSTSLEVQRIFESSSFVGERRSQQHSGRNTEEHAFEVYPRRELAVELAVKGHREHSSLSSEPPRGWAVLALCQSHGRGRRRSSGAYDGVDLSTEARAFLSSSSCSDVNVWYSPPGHFYASYLFPRALWPRASLQAAWVVADYLESVLGYPPLIKWPNDILVSGRKLAGLLLEGTPQASGSDVSFEPSSHISPYMCIGVGINVLWSCDADVAMDASASSASDILGATSLCQLGGDRAILGEVAGRQKALREFLEEMFRHLGQGFCQYMHPHLCDDLLARLPAYMPRSGALLRKKGLQKCDHKNDQKSERNGARKATRGIADRHVSLKGVFSACPRSESSPEDARGNDPSDAPHYALWGGLASSGNLSALSLGGSYRFEVASAAHSYKLFLQKNLGLSSQDYGEGPKDWRPKDWRHRKEPREKYSNEDHARSHSSTNEAMVFLEIGNTHIKGYQVTAQWWMEQSGSEEKTGELPGGLREKRWRCDEMFSDHNPPMSGHGSYVSGSAVGSHGPEGSLSLSEFYVTEIIRWWDSARPRGAVSNAGGEACALSWPVYVLAPPCDQRSEALARVLQARTQRQLLYQPLPQCSYRLDLADYPRDHMGPDRVCFMEGVLASCFSRGNSSWTMAVSWGTAMTVDFITLGGVYLGGVIFPGPWLSLKSLAQGSVALARHLSILLDAEPEQISKDDEPGERCSRTDDQRSEFTLGFDSLPCMKSGTEAQCLGALSYIFSEALSGRLWGGQKIADKIYGVVAGAAGVGGFCGRIYSCGGTDAANASLRARVLDALDRLWLDHQKNHSYSDSKVAGALCDHNGGDHLYEHIIWDHGPYLLRGMVELALAPDRRSLS